VRLKSKSLHREETKVEEFEHLEFLQVLEEKCQSSVGAIDTIGSAEKIWTIEDFTSREKQEKCAGEWI
jgi:hypothetical protein